MKPDEIKAIRKKMAVSQEKFASLLGTTTVSVNRWERGRVKPSRLYLREIKTLKANRGSYICRLKESKNT